MLKTIVAELDRKVAEERRRLQEVREAVCRSSPPGSRGCSPVAGQYSHPPGPTNTAAEKDLAYVSVPIDKFLIQM